MRQIIIDPKTDTASGTAGIAAYVRVEVWGVRVGNPGAITRVDADEVVFPAALDFELDGVTTVDLDDWDVPANCWLRLTLLTAAKDPIKASPPRDVADPEGESAVPYGDLVDIDWHTMNPLDPDVETVATIVETLNAQVPTSGSGAPGTTPSSLGAIYIDTVGSVVYVSTGSSSPADWTALNS